jgi:hypothetical protein
VWAAVPAGWRELGELEVEGRARKRDDQVWVESRRAYGDLASGCFALLQRASAPARGFNLGRMQAALMQALQAAGFTAGPNSAELPFLGRGVQGRVRSTTAPAEGGRIAVLSLACFYNGREPERCRPMCDAMLDSAGTGR